MQGQAHGFTTLVVACRSNCWVKGCALRRWQVMAPSLTKFAGVVAALGHDIEYEIWRSLFDFQCSAVFAKYLQVSLSPFTAA